MSDIKPLRRKLGHKEKKFIGFCEVFYFDNNKGFPTPEQAAVALRYSVTEINFFLQNINVQEALERRGLPYRSAGAQSGQLSSTQIATAVTMCNFADERSSERKLEELGVLSSQYYAWLQDPVFNAFVNNMANRNLEHVKPEALTQFSRLIRQGDFNALKYYFEVTGQFAQGAESVENLKIVIQRLIEVVQEEVKDPAVLKAISEKILNVAPVTAPQVEVTFGRSNALTGHTHDYS